VTDGRVTPLSTCPERLTCHDRLVHDRLLADVALEKPSAFNISWQARQGDATREPTW
jgi:hypothetical protein